MKVTSRVGSRGCQDRPRCVSSVTDIHSSRHIIHASHNRRSRSQCQHIGSLGNRRRRKSRRGACKLARIGSRRTHDRCAIRHLNSIARRTELLRLSLSLVGDRKGIQNGRDLHCTSAAIPSEPLQGSCTDRGCHTRTCRCQNCDLASIHLRCASAATTRRTLRSTRSRTLKCFVDDHSSTTVSVSSTSRSNLHNCTDSSRRKCLCFRACVEKDNRGLPSESHQCSRRNRLTSICSSNCWSTSHRSHHANPCIVTAVRDLTTRRGLSRSSGLGRSCQVKGTRCTATPDTPTDLVGGRRIGCNRSVLIQLSRDVRSRESTRCRKANRIATRILRGIQELCRI